METKNRKNFRQWPVILAILIVGILVGIFLLMTGPRTQPGEKQRGSRIVRTIQLVPGSHNVNVTGYGSVIPAQRVVIRPQVQGRILEQHPQLVPGGRIQVGEVLFKIDPSDYEIAVKEQEFALEEARFSLEMEQGNQVVASREWKILEQELPENEINRSLVLRQPHLRRAQASLDRAENQIARAELDLSRTVIKAPFNAIVLEESVDQGQLVNTGADTCILVGSDQAWVMTTISLQDLTHIQYPSGERPGSKAMVYLDTGEEEPLVWEGRVSQLLSDLEPTGRMARVIVETPDPYGLDPESDPNAAPLLIGSYVKVVIDVGEIENALEIPRTALREGSRIWVVDQEKRLQIRETNILWTRKDTVLVENRMQEGETLIVSGLKVALPGMVVEPFPVDEEGGNQNTTRTTP